MFDEDFRHDIRVSNLKEILSGNRLKSISILVIILALIGIYAGHYLSKRADIDLEFVSGTAYISGEKGQVIVRLSDGLGTPITDAECNATIIYPDKDYFIIDQGMLGSSIPGNYYIDFVTPDETGIYEEIVVCDIDVDGDEMTLDISSSFQVSIALNMIMELASNQTSGFDEVSTKIDSIQSDIDGISVRMDSIEAEINNTNTTLNNKFEDLYSDWKDVSDAMSGIFSN